MQAYGKMTYLPCPIIMQEKEMQQKETRNKCTENLKYSYKSAVLFLSRLSTKGHATDFDSFELDLMDHLFPLNSIRETSLVNSRDIKCFF